MPTINSVGLTLYPVPGGFYLNCWVCGCLLGRWATHVFVCEGRQCKSVCSLNISFSGKEGDTLKEIMTFWKEPQGNFNSHRTQRDHRNWKREMAFLALPTADLYFEASYSHSGVQEPGWYLHSTAFDITLPDSVTQKHNVQFVSLLPASVLSGQVTLLHCTHPAPHPSAVKKGLEMFKVF